MWNTQETGLNESTETGIERRVRWALNFEEVARCATKLDFVCFFPALGLSVGSLVLTEVAYSSAIDWLSNAEINLSLLEVESS